MTETEPTVYTVPASAYAAVYLRRRATIPALIFTALLFAAFVAGFSDIRWWLVGMMAVFIVAPMGVAMAWFIVTGRRDMAIRLRPQSVTADRDSITVGFYPFDYDVEHPEANHTVLLRPDKIVSVKAGTRYMTLYTTGIHDFDLILIPVEVLPSHPIYDK